MATQMRSPVLGDVVIYHDSGATRPALVVGIIDRQARRIALRVFAVNPANDKVVATTDQASSIDDATVGTWDWP